MDFFHSSQCESMEALDFAPKLSYWLFDSRTVMEDSWE